mgnify:CR=1 FL=1
MAILTVFFTDNRVVAVLDQSHRLTLLVHS